MTIVLNETHNEIKDRITNLFGYLKDYYLVKVPPVVNFKNHEWNLFFNRLPQHLSIKVNFDLHTNDEEVTKSKEEVNDWLLKVKRAKETPCPDIPECLVDWIQSNWRSIDAKIEKVESKFKNSKTDEPEPIIEKFEDSEKRVEAYRTWNKAREEWKEIEIPIRKANKVFSNLFELWGKLQAESEKYQLYFANGFFRLNNQDYFVEHPLIMQKLQIEFNSEIPEFVIKETEDEPEFYFSLLRHLNVEPKGLIECREIMKNNLFSPYPSEDLKGFLKYVIQRFWQNGEFIENTLDIQKKTNPLVYLEPVIFLGIRNQGFLDAVDNYLEKLKLSDEMPEALSRLVGFDLDGLITSEITDVKDSDEQENTETVKNEVDYLLTKPANNEQKRIIESLKQNGTVIVQGPPGTGKSHTIANIIGQLLAENKTVLVTSETAKALSVIRDKVVKPLQPLCVSVLGNDDESKTQLEESVRGIIGYFTKTDKAKIFSEIKDLKEKREQLKQKETELIQELIRIRKDEYSDIVFAGEGINPSIAARKIADGFEINDWIPLPIEENTTFPLSLSEISELYLTNLNISKEQEELLLSDLPDITELPSHLTFKEFSQNFSKAQRLKQDSEADLDYWANKFQNYSELEAFRDKIEYLINDLNIAENLYLKCIEDGKKGRDCSKVWIDFIDFTREKRNIILSQKTAAYHFDVDIKLEKPLYDLINICENIIEYLKHNKSIGFLTTITRPSWKDFIKEILVNNRQPKSIEHFECILAKLKIDLHREELSKRWNRQLTNYGVVDAQKLGNEPEEVALKYAEKMEYYINWYNDKYQTLIKEAEEIGFNLTNLLDFTNVDPLISYGEILELRKILQEKLLRIIENRLFYLNYYNLELQRETWLTYLKSFPKNQTSMQLIEEFIVAISNNDSENYKNLYLGLGELTSLKAEFDKRNTLLKKLEKYAPTWAKSIRDRIPPHNNHKCPNDPEIAWKYAQWKQELDKRHKNNLDLVQKELYKVQWELQDITANYVEKLAWSAQINRLGLEQQMALNGWLQIQGKIGKGTGKRVPRLRAEAKNLLSKCKNSVPVWIMPLSRVVESFDFKETCFDVVIIDEASQSDITALASFAIAKEIIVVGDNEQVSPYGIGQNLEVIQSLIDTYLYNIPNKELYDGKTSIYDLACLSFGETIRLVEHFRCVPDIIEFSNHLCYSGEIKPLREESGSNLAPSIVAHRIPTGFTDSKINKNEAMEIVYLIAAICQIPEYKNKTIGVISLVGAEQAEYIRKKLENILPLNEFRNRKVLCGNASRFQGDERDIMLLSMVDTSDGVPLRIKQDSSYKKIINVATSRAKDQLWVVHSLNPDTDLKTGDLRLRLLKHAENPKAISNQIEREGKKADSEFERKVLKDLSGRGYKVITQWKVGSFRIDLVVEGNGKRIAIECDGDRYHPPEKFNEDMERQLILERLGWRFIRIRGSEYFQSPDKTMNRVVQRLEEYGLLPVYNEENNEAVELIDDTLIKRVIRVAQDIRKESEAVEEEPKESELNLSTSNIV